MASSERLSPYATPSATREVLERHGLFTKYALGQNFLVNDDVVRKIMDLADVCASDHVLEVGPGIGTLTAALLQRANHVTSIEMDHDLPAVLNDTLSPWLDRFTLLEMDGLDVRREHLEQGKSQMASELQTQTKPQMEGGPQSQVKPQMTNEPHEPDTPNKLVSNLPYAVAATIVLDYLQRFDFLESATVMVQKEVADRMMAQPGTKVYGAYTVKLGLFAQAAGRFSVAPGNFFPPPHVESAVVRLDRITVLDDEGNTLSTQELIAACTMADAAFATRRKTLANSCKTYFSSTPELAALLPDFFEQAGIDPRRRGETLTREEFIRLGKVLARAQSQNSG